MSSNPSENLQKSGIVEFTIEDIVTMSSSGESVDKNKFLMRDNTFTANFAGMQKTIVYLQGIRRIHMSGDTYKHNSGVFAEALNSFGAIETAGVVIDYEKPGAFTFGSFYIDEDETNSINSQANLLDVKVATLYPDGIILIDSTFYVELSSLTFDNNYFQEQLPNDVPSSTYRSMTLTITRSQGEVHLDTLTIQNYFGWDLGALETILGSSEYANVVTMDPTERDESGNPNTTPTLPEYAIDYAFRSQLITLGYPDTSSSEDFKNYFDKIEITSLTVDNITRYDTSSSDPLVLVVSDDWGELSISTMTISDVDMILSETTMFDLQPYGSLYVSGGTISNINKNAYDLDTTDYDYIPQSGAVFSINSYKEQDDLGDLEWTVEDLVLDGIYARLGGSIYLSKQDDEKEGHPITLTVSNVTFQNSYSKNYGTFYVPDTYLSVLVDNWTFTGNTGINSEADFFFTQATEFKVLDTIFTKFSSIDIPSTRGKSISVSMSTPFEYYLEFEGVTVKCSDTAFDSDTYEALIQNAGTDLTDKSPIYLATAGLITKTCTFSNCFVAKEGGIIKSGSNSEYTDTGSTFTQNAAQSGGAIYFEGTYISMTSTTLSYNYAKDGGALAFTLSSEVAVFSGIT